MLDRKVGVLSGGEKVNFAQKSVYVTIAIKVPSDL
jgi:hypothetical protein